MSSGDVLAKLQKQADENINELMDKMSPLDFLRLAPSLKTTPEMNLEIIRKYPGYFESMPADKKTREMCMYIIESGYFSNPLRKNRIPQRFWWDGELLASCVKHGIELDWILWNIPPNRIGETFWKSALQQPNSETIKTALERDIFEQYGLTLDAAISTNGLALAGVPKAMRSKELCEIAVNADGLALEFVPKDMRSRPLCQTAVHKDGLALRSVPQSERSPELYCTALENTPLALRYCPKKYWTEAAFFKAILEDPSLVSLAPARILNHCSWSEIIEQNWRILAYAPTDILSVHQVVSVYRKVLEQNLAASKSPPQGGHKGFLERSYETQAQQEMLFKIAQRLPEQTHNNEEIISLERELKLRVYVNRTFDLERKVYLVDEKFRYITRMLDEQERLALREAGEMYFHVNGADYSLYDGAKVEHHAFPSFEGFLSYCGGNLEGVGEDILLSRELDDKTFYNCAILSWMNAGPSELRDEGYLNDSLIVHDDIEQMELFHDSFELWRTKRKIFYISDIHLTHKVANKFPDGASKLEIQAYVRELTQAMFQSEHSGWDNVLLIGGDVASEFEIAALFYEAVSDFWRGMVVTVLGNHDLWPFSNLKSAYQKYEELFQRLGRNFLLLNGLLFYTPLGHMRHIPCERLMEVTPEQFQNTAKWCSLILFGGIGFSGKNPTFNAETGFIYRQAVSREDDIRETEHFEAAYNKLVECLGNETVVVLTHTPKEDWHSGAYHPGWIYVNGHTHRNHYQSDDKITLYADNQIGYKPAALRLKYFYLSRYCDIFRYYADGIYPISRMDYLDYLRYLGTYAQFNRSGGELFLLRRSGFSCFIYRANQRNYLLNGGTLNRLPYDMDYYYEHMEYYAQAVNDTLAKYFSALKHIANAIRIIGGSGTIHGCIVDIDFFNHIFLNPLDGSITPYYALDMTMKFKYPSLDALLQERLPQLHESYAKSLADDGKANKLAIFRQGNLKTSQYSGATFVGDTSMYSLSRVMRSYQYMQENRLIRRWDESLVQKMKSLAEKRNQLSGERK